ncbi:mechanosensitive ion channel family protein [Halanaerobaculum tunisiense]
MELVAKLREFLSYKLILSLVVIISSYFLTLLIIRFINRQIDTLKRRHQARRSTYYLMTVITIIILLFIWLQQKISLTTYLGFLSAGLTLALHQVLLNIVGWLLLIFKRPFSLGDRIEWSETQGDVIDIGVFYTTLLEVGNRIAAEQSTGRLVQMPNANLFKEPVFNYTRGFGCIWNETEILITFESDWQKAREIMLEIVNQEKEEGVEDRAKKRVKEMSKNYMIKYSAFTPITYLDIESSGVQITLRYLTSVRQRRTVEDRIYERILVSFAQEPDIDLAYPTKRVYNRGEENDLN